MSFITNGVKVTDLRTTTGDVQKERVFGSAVARILKIPETTPIDPTVRSRFHTDSDCIIFTKRITFISAI